MIRCLLLASIAFALAASAAAAEGPGLPLVRHQLRDPLGRQIAYHASRPARPAPTPILLMIQGSGCGALLPDGGGSTLFNLLPFAAEGRYTVVAVEKPQASIQAAGGTAERCSPAFHADFTAERWLIALRAVLAEVRRRPDVDRRRTVVLGASEGAVMAALLAGEDPRVTHVIAISGSGTTQLFDFLANAHAGCFDRSACLAGVEDQARAIAADPESATKFAWGHPFRRWSSFFRVDPGEALVRSKARAYIAMGTADASVPALSQEVAVAKLLAVGRDVTVRRVPGADHSLMQPGRADYTALNREYRRALAWVETPATRQTQVPPETPSGTASVTSDTPGVSGTLPTR